MADEPKPLSDTDLRKTAAKGEILFCLARMHPNLSDGAYEYLMDAAIATAAYSQFVAGREKKLDTTSVLIAVERSNAHSVVFRKDLGKTETGEIDHEAAIQKMTPRERMDYARQHNLR